jgi:hypothetical protein
MKSPFYFIVKPKDGKRYDDERNGIIISTSKEDYKASTREAVVIETPIGWSCSDWRYSHRSPQHI